MKISPINHKMNFGYKFPNQLEQTTYDGDDLSCQEDRKFLREKLFANFPYNEEHQEYRLDPNALKYLIIDVTKNQDIDKVNREIWAKRAARKEAKKTEEPQEEMSYYEKLAKKIFSQPAPEMTVYEESYYDFLFEVFADEDNTFEDICYAVGDITEEIATENDYDINQKTVFYNQIFEAITDEKTFIEEEKQVLYDIFYKKIAEVNDKANKKQEVSTETTKTYQRSQYSNRDQFFDSDLIEREVYAVNKRVIANNIHAMRGAMVDDEDDIEILKKAGVKTIIDLRAGQEKDYDGIKHFTKLCTAHSSFGENPAFMTKKGYVDHKVARYRRYGFDKETLKKDAIRVAEEWEEEKAKLVDILAEYVDLVNQGNFYIGCDLGTASTTEALAINNIINPKVYLIGGRFSKNQACKYLNLLQNLTDEDKKKIGITPDFYKDRIQYLKECSESN